MHEPIRESLEEYLKGSREKLSDTFHAHLAACEACGEELRHLEMQARLLRSLQANDEVEPRAGFYGRVMGRIDDQRRSSIWSVFLEPRFGRRLAMASAALIVLLGTYLVTTDDLGEPNVEPASMAILSDSNDSLAPAPEPVFAQDTLEQQQQRNAVLVDLASYHE